MSKTSVASVIKPKYLGYCRKSTDEKEKQILSIDQQIDELKTFASRENLEIVEFFVEKKTAKEPGRSVFNNLLKLVEKGLADGIVAWHPDRLARNSVDGGKIIYLLDTGQLQDLKFPTFWFQNTPQGKFMLNIAFGQSKYYVDNLSENVKRGLHFKARRGEWPSFAPFGYKNDRNTRNIVVVPQQTELVKYVFTHFASGELSSTRDVRSYLFKKGVKRKNGRPLHYNQIRAILTRSLYYGVFIYGGETYESKLPPLISQELFDKVQVRLKRLQPTNLKKHEFNFTGLMKCIECGSFITAESHTKHYKCAKRTAVYIYYRCVKKKGVCSQPYVTEAEVETQLREIVKKCSLSPIWEKGFMELLLKDELEARARTSVELCSITTSLEAVEKKLSRLLELYLEESIEAEDYQLKKNQLLHKKLDLKSQIERVKADGVSWLEPLRNFIIESANADKIARAKENRSDLAITAKKVGSNYLLFDKRIHFSPNNPHISLAARPIAACDEPSAPLLCGRQDLNLHGFLHTHLKRT
ncbi:recombinase family protein, partial [Candidatus Woesebacteria bacterium]|nr:recombinase family protein [Candidatus Woesebacteria bacterium]